MHNSMQTKAYCAKRNPSSIIRFRSGCIDVPVAAVDCSHSQRRLVGNPCTGAVSQIKKRDLDSTAKTAPETFKEIYRLRRPFGIPSRRLRPPVAHIIVAFNDFCCRAYSGNYEFPSRRTQFGAPTNVTEDYTRQIATKNH